MLCNAVHVCSCLSINTTHPETLEKTVQAYGASYSVHVQEWKAAIQVYSYLS